MPLHPNAQQSFYAALGLRKRDPLLESALEQIVDRAHAKWPNVKLSDEVFLSRLGARVKESSSVVGMLGRLRTSDLFVAWAAEGHDETAIKSIITHTRKTLEGALAPMNLAAHERDEVLLRLQERVFVGEKPRIGSFSGTGSIGTWLAAAVVRLAIDAKRAVRPEDELNDELASAVADTSDLELELIRKRYQSEFRDAFHSAFLALTLDERNLVRLTFIDRLSIDALGAMTGLHRSTVARRIAALRDELAKGTRKRLQEKFRLTASDVNSLMRVVVTAFDTSLGGMMRERGGSQR
jgi:RNA polymerase sigma-70 factor, ECF subfamily